LRQAPPDPTTSIFTPQRWRRSPGRCHGRKRRSYTENIEVQQGESWSALGMNPAAMYAMGPTRLSADRKAMLGKIPPERLASSGFTGVSGSRTAGLSPDRRRCPEVSANGP
jgi:hypothetical protein